MQTSKYVKDAFTNQDGTLFVLIKPNFRGKLTAEWTRHTRGAYGAFGFHSSNSVSDSLLREFDTVEDAYASAKAEAGL